MSQHAGGPFQLSHSGGLLARRAAGRVGISRQESTAVGGGDRDVSQHARRPFQLRHGGDLLASMVEGLSRAVRVVAFSPNGQVLYTNVGEIPLLSPSLVLLPSWQQKQAFNILVQDQWISRKQQRFLWLPSEYRSGATAVHEDTACLGLVSGRVVLLRIL
jgi:hypothetical protein